MEEKLRTRLVSIILHGSGSHGQNTFLDIFYFGVKKMVSLETIPFTENSNVHRKTSLLSLPDLLKHLLR